MFRLGELAARLGLEFRGAPGREVTSLASLRQAGPDQLSIFTDERYLPDLRESAAGVVLLSPEYVSDCPGDCLLADEPFQGLAPLDAELVGQALRSMARSGCAVIASGHEVPALLEVADEVVWQTAGTTHLLGSPDQARSNHQFVREYLGLAGLAG